MFSKRNIFIGFVVIALLGAGGYYWWQQQQAAEQKARADAIRSEVAQVGDIFATVSATGNLAPQAQVNLFFATNAPLPVTAINVVVGQSVRQGEVLATLDTAELALAVTQAEQNLQTVQLALTQLQTPPRPEDLAVAEANLRVAKARVYQASQGKTATDVEIARLNLVLAQTALNQTHDTMERLEEQGRWDQKNALQSQADQQVQNAQVAELRYEAAQAPPRYGAAVSAMAGVEQAQAALDRLKAGPSAEDLEIARLQVSQAQVALELAQHNLAETQLTAPFDGVVAAVNVRVGEPTASVLPAVVLADLRQFYLDVAVDEVDVAQVSVGQLVTVTLDALPNELLSARVQKIAPTATTTQGVVSYQVRLILDPTAAALRGGMTATAEIVVAEAHDVVLVPNWAIRRDRQTGTAFVGVLVNGEIKDVPITLGLRDETFSEVVSGLTAGETIAVDTTREQFSLFGTGGE